MLLEVVIVIITLAMLSMVIGLAFDESGVLDIILMSLDDVLHSHGHINK